MRQIVVLVLSVLALACAVAGVAVLFTAWLGWFVGLGAGLLSATVALLMLAWQVEKT